MFFQNKIYGCYGKEDVLRLNLMILLFHLLESNSINEEVYNNLNDYLDNDSFTINTLFIEEVTNYLSQLEIQIDMILHEENGKCALEYILNHIEFRMKGLDEKMKKDSRIKVTFPGESAKKHELGPVYFDHWKLLDKENCQKLTKAMYDFISVKIEDLEQKYEGRVKFGEVMYDNASCLNYQVWSANAANWDLPEGSLIPGKFQAKQMKYQETGVYGIVVSPRYGYHEIIPPEYLDCTRPV